MNDKKVFSNKVNTTKYGEFVCSEFEWLPLYKQKEKARKLERMTMDEDSDLEL